MIDGSEKRNRQLAFELQNRMFVKCAVIVGFINYFLQSVRVGLLVR